MREEARLLLRARGVSLSSGTSLAESGVHDAPLPAGTADSAAISILVCADEIIRRESARGLKATGMVLHQVQGWSEALSKARDLRPSAVLLESSFLEGAGSDLCASLRRAWGSDETPVLALCRNTREMSRALAAGASDVVETPVDWNLVERRLRNLAGARRARAELEANRRQMAQAHVDLAEGRRKFEQGSLMDGLTGLPNRLQMERILERAIRAGAGPVALIVLDLDDFSEFNETRGRAAGDEVLRASARRLIGCLRAWPVHGGQGPGIMSAARLGGAEFAVMLQNSDPDRLASLAQLVRDALGLSLTVGEKSVRLTVSIGMAVTADPGMDSETLLRRAETSMYAARRSGSPFCLYGEDVGRLAEEAGLMDHRLRDAFGRGELQLHYQPVLAAGSRRILAVEALLRWSDGPRGWIPPAEFVPVAERAGMMGAIGVWVLEAACRQLRSWMDDGLPPIKVAINVSRSQIEFGDFAAEVSRVLKDTRLEPSQLELELSERGALRRDPRILDQLDRLKALGVRLVVDDFGTGETAVAHLRRHALDGMKIDGALVREVESEDRPSLSQAMAGLGRQLRLHVVAECVETETELARMIALGCDAVQGFLFSRPVPSEELRTRMRLSPDQPGVCELAEAV